MNRFYYVLTRKVDLIKHKNDIFELDSFNYNTFQSTVFEVLDRIINNEISKEEQTRIGVVLNDYINICYVRNLETGESVRWVERGIDEFLNRVIEKINSSPDKLGILICDTFCGVDWKKIEDMKSDIASTHNLTLRELGKAGSAALKEDNNYGDQGEINQLLGSIAKSGELNKEKRGFY